MKNKNPWKTISSKVVYKNPWIKVRGNDVIRPNGKKGWYGVVEIRPASYVIALTKKQELYLVGQFRYPINQFSWEIPAGVIEELSPLIAAKRELKEETGLTAKKWQNLGFFYLSTGSSNEKGHVFVAQDLNQTGQHIQEDDGIVEMRKVPLGKVFNMLKKGEIIDGATISCLMKLSIYLGQK